MGMVIYDNEFVTKENKISTKDKIEPQHIYLSRIAKTWLQKSLLYTFWLSLVVEDFFSIVTFYLFNRYRIGHSR